MKIEIDLSGKRYEVEILYKAMRSIRLRVTDAGEIRLSAPKRTPRRELERFLQAHRRWLEAALEHLERKIPPMRDERLEPGGLVRLRGEAYTVEHMPGAKVEFSADHGARSIRISCPPGTDSERLRAPFEKWWRGECYALYGELCARFLPLFSAHGVKMPALTVRKMRAQWGSCNAAAGRVNLNFYLMRAPMECIEYVVLHELTHMINQTHNKVFYAFIERVMPDWRRRRELLKRERSC